jgi:hypothetical protein
LTAGTRRNGTSKVGPFHRAAPSHRAQPRADQPHAGQPDRRELGLTGRPGGPRDKAARFRAGKVVPAAAVAATLAAGATAFTMVSGGGSPPQASQLNAARGQQSGGAGIGRANGAASPIGGTATATTRPAARHAKPSVRPTPSSPPPSASRPATPATPASPTASAAKAASVPASAPASAGQTAPASTGKTAPATLSCNLSAGLLPDNVTAIVSFLLAHGYSHNAAAGIAGNMYQESKGNPESVGMGGGGLIGWTPLPSGFVTGNVSADLNTQLSALLTYNQGWAQYLPVLNAAATPADAAAIYVTDFERAGIPAASTRESSAQAVSTACGL